ncbi:hypothetical protein SKAU_G00334210 [Synaphobranchus kaupii]|uniref:Uncharacterized protein n=1 Tax=Synaphobranchus kaupii TaxID=118154 RepID=A0A9Q1IHW1_SYNKA|nr:hypothetical protein SKAU_G00334210 [Synaphobranchus kaupii]
MTNTGVTQKNRSTYVVALRLARLTLTLETQDSMLAFAKISCCFTRDQASPSSSQLPGLHHHSSHEQRESRSR